MERPAFIRHWTALEGADDAHYPGDTELLSIRAALGKSLGLTRLGIHHERLPPGRRTSYPHAESAEEEFVFVLDGEPDVWIDGDLHRLRAGDAVAFPAGTGICHTFMNNTDGEVRLLIVANPCFGLDVKAVAETRARIMAARNAGTAVLLISEDLDEILELADRIVVMRDGRIAAELPAAGADPQEIGKHMLGTH